MRGGVGDVQSNTFTRFTSGVKRVRSKCLTSHLEILPCLRLVLSLEASKRFPISLKVNGSSAMMRLSKISHSFSLSRFSKLTKPFLEHFRFEGLIMVPDGP